MSNKPSCPVIAIEEHYWDPELTAAWDAVDRVPNPEIQKRMLDLDDLRLREMDEGGIDMQVLSHAAPATQKLGADVAVDLTRRVNDRLAATIARHPTRYAGFAALPTASPAAAADELSRCIEKLGFKGAMLHGIANGAFLDDQRFWPIFARAEALDVPIYLHPATPHPAVIDAYYKDYVKAFPSIISAAWGFGVETATLAVRLVLSGIFEKHPRLKIILGHFGEMIPFFLWRIDYSLKRPGAQPLAFRDLFCKHFYVTTSGNFSDSTLLCTMMEMGADRILFAVDWPFVPNAPGPKWMSRAPISEDDKIKILSGNVKRLLKL
jgi:predicted TIM-barrel fold metal-dependent hydrolase